jgi:hypothetical protein
MVHLPDLTDDHYEKDILSATGTEGRSATQFATSRADDEPMSMVGNEIGQEGGRLLISGL